MTWFLTTVGYIVGYIVGSFVAWKVIERFFLKKWVDDALKEKKV